MCRLPCFNPVINAILVIGVVGILLDQILPAKAERGGHGICRAVGSKVGINCSLSAACRCPQKVQSLCHDPWH